MALQVWMPLIKQELTQQGLSSGTLSGTPNWGQGGKISEKCFRCDGPITTTIDGLKNVTTFSIAYWLYVDSSISTFTNYADFFELQATSGNTTTIIRDELRANTANLGRHAFHMIKDASVGSNTYTYYGLGDRDDAKNKWCHVVVTKDANYCDAYADGVRYAHVACSNFESSPCKLTGVMQLGMAGCTSGYLQDFRVYDHVLSQMEVKELSKGLVLHYPLNRGGWGQENLFGYGSDCSDLSNMTNGGSKYELVTEDGYKCAHRAGVLQTTATLQTKIPLTPTSYSGQSFVLSCDVKIKNIAHGTTNFFIGPYMSGQTVDGSWKGFNTSAIYIDGILQTSKTNQYDTHIHDTKWHRYALCGTFPDAAFTINLYPNFYARDFTGDVYIKNLKLEMGLIPTSWCPNSSDALATTMGLNGTIEYDCSGFCNNGTRTGTFSWTSDTPKYSVSQYFEDYTRYISCQMGTSWIPDAITMSCWVKGTNKSARGGYHIPLNMHSTNFEISITSSSGKARMGYVVGGTRYVSDIGSDILDGKWHMLTSTFNGSTICRYVDGILVNSENRSGTLTAAQTLGVGAFPGGTTYGNTQLYESDVRIYATALSASDVKSLYQNSAYIDSSGNVYGAVHSEV